MENLSEKILGAAGRGDVSSRGKLGPLFHATGAQKGETFGESLRKNFVRGGLVEAAAGRPTE